VPEILEISHDSAEYPTALKASPEFLSVESLFALGNLNILKQKTLALFCSIRCPGNIILQVFDFIKSLQQTKVPLISGFHSPMERECLEMLLRGKHPVIACPARSLQGMRIRREYNKPLEDGRLLFLSPFPETQRRQSEQNAIVRNHFVAALADKIFIPYAAPESKTEQFCKDIIKQHPLFTLENKDNANLIAIGAKPLPPNNVKSRSSF